MELPQVCLGINPNHQGLFYFSGGPLYLNPEWGRVFNNKIRKYVKGFQGFVILDPQTKTNSTKELTFYIITSSACTSIKSIGFITIDSSLVDKIVPNGIYEFSEDKMMLCPFSVV